MYAAVIKRALDVVCAAAGLIAVSPLMAVIVLCVKLGSPGPVFFAQKRVGKGKKLFFMLKFRSMRVDTPKDTPTHLLRDPYAFITPVGRFLRKTSLDELPQLWNILKGDMSFVGPRPALWNQEDLIAERERLRANDIRPGLTGLAQVNGRDELPIPLKAAYDGQYREKITFASDCRILWRTVFNVLRGSGVSEGGPG